MIMASRKQKIGWKLRVRKRLAGLLRRGGVELGEGRKLRAIVFGTRDGLRARRLGFEIMVSAGALLMHNLGAKQEFTVVGRKVRPTFHSALRLRYMFRNRWMLWRRHAWYFPHWAAFDLIYSHYNLLRILAFEDHRLQKMIAVIRGSWDGLCNKRGEIL